MNRKNTYITPKMLCIRLNTLNIMAGSYIETGSTDGQGHGEFEANARAASSSWIIGDEEDEE